MSREQFERFRELVLQDQSMQDQLRDITENDRFVTRVIELASEKGLNFTPEQVRAAMDENSRLWIERWI